MNFTCVSTGQHFKAEGIFRISGSVEEVNRLKAKYDIGKANLAVERFILQSRVTDWSWF